MSYTTPISDIFSLVALNRLIVDSSYMTMLVMSANWQWVTVMQGIGRVDRAGQKYEVKAYIILSNHEDEQHMSVTCNDKRSNIIEFRETTPADRLEIIKDMLEERKSCPCRPCTQISPRTPVLGLGLLVLALVLGLGLVLLYPTWLACSVL
jgi:hypothetical protein